VDGGSDVSDDVDALLSPVVERLERYFAGDVRPPLGPRRARRGRLEKAALTRGRQASFVY
jgi:hypothetical protein